MASQNLVSAEITPETLAKSLVKLGNWFMPFLDLAHRSVNDHPDIMPRLFDLAEFKKDFQLIQDLTKLDDQLQALCEGLRNTLAAVGSGALVACLEIYSATKSNSDRVTGLKVAAAEMSEFLRKSRAKPAAGAKA